MVISSKILDILACPESKQGLSWVGTQEIDQLNSEIKKGNISTVTGAKVEQPLEMALVREDRKRLYRVENGIPILLVEEGINYLP